MRRVRPATEPWAEADYVVIGAGSAGCVLAGRLSQDPGVTVAVLEAGGADDADEIHIPAALYKLFRTAHDWNYDTAPQPHADDRRLFWPRGKVLGGSSSINAMLYIRGNRLDYDTWAADGATGWDFVELLPYFRRSEDNARGADEFHGVGGPLRVEDQPDPHEISEAMLAASVQAGVPANADVNGAVQDGVTLFQVTQRGGRRWSTADAFLHPAARRDNLHVLVDALVHRVVIEGGRATGVQFEHRGAVRTIRARREILLAGGAVNSPQTLMLSGVGPAQHLREHGIDVLVDSPSVGQRLQDHPLAPVEYFTHDTPDLLAQENVANMGRWFAGAAVPPPLRGRARGPLTSPVAEVCAFVRTDATLPAPDIQFHMIPTMMAEHGLRAAPGHGLTMCAVLVDVASRGTITLASADPRHKPVIDAGYLTDDRDLHALVRGVGIARDIAARPALQPFLGAEHWPGDAYPQVADFVRAELQTLYHPTSTCALGSDDDDVVDLELRVRGVDGLRVVDASVMPGVPRGNTNAPTIAIAEKAVDLIRSAH